MQNKRPSALAVHLQAKMDPLPESLRNSPATDEDSIDAYIPCTIRISIVVIIHGVHTVCKAFALYEMWSVTHRKITRCFSISIANGSVRYSASDLMDPTISRSSGQSIAR